MAVPSETPGYIHYTIGRRECASVSARTRHQLRTLLRSLTRQYRLNFSPFNSIGPVRVLPPYPTHELPDDVTPRCFVLHYPHIPST